MRAVQTWAARFGWRQASIECRVNQLIMPCIVEPRALVTHSDAAWRARGERRTMSDMRIVAPYSD